MQPCTGTLLCFPVAADDRFPTEAAVAQCSDCGYIAVVGGVLDERHADSQAVPVD